MGLFSKDIKTFDELFAHGLKDIFYAEQQIVEALPKMIEKAANSDLKNGLKQHLGETEDQVKRLEEVFRLRGEEARGTRCAAIDGLIKEGDTVMGEIDNETVMDAAIVAAAQAVEHYEITRYGALIGWATELGRADVARVLKTTLEEEKAADRKLAQLTAARVNPRADAGSARAGGRLSGTAETRRVAERAEARRAPSGRTKSGKSAKGGKSAKAGKKAAARRSR